MKASNAELVALVAGEVTAESLAEKHGVSEQEVLAWRSAFREGMRAASAGQSATRRRINPRWAIGAVVIATAAFAQLTVFSANTPAIASEVNANFAQLKTWLEQKVGTVGTGNVTINGSLRSGHITPAYVTWGVSGDGSAAIANDNASYKALMIAGNTSSGGSQRKIQLYDDVTIANDLNLGGNVTMNGNFAPRSGENLRIIRGNVALNGTTVGSGFTVSGTSTSTPSVNFNTAFSGVPTVVCSVGPSPASLDACAINSVSASGFQAIIGVRNVGYFAEPFHFIAIGPN